MAAITNGLLQAQRTDLRKIFNDAYKAMAAETFWSKVATRVPSSSASNTYGWLGEWPKLREWVGDRVVKDIKESGYAIQNRKFEATVGIARTAIEDDTVGLYDAQIRELAQQCAMFPDYLIAEAMVGGETTLCFDGQNYFDTDHPVYPNHDGTGTAATVSNLTAGAADPWYLLDLSRPLRPFIFQERTSPEFDALTDAAKTDSVFMTDQYLYGARYRCAAGYGFWQMAHKAKVALTDANYLTVRTAMRGRKADGGRPLGIKPTHIVVSPANFAAAKALFGVEYTAAGASNPWYKSVEVIEADWLS